ncbi:type III-A CRISPR-associated RAMP protein Csm4 [Thermodesulfovibrio yellowstonii]|uniref:CRISPR system Cms protein Csm4 n=1 Tax=Thermodesulfovibrio yellowstonii (strain ATCC 51303 / DSM 11347 / YP87) TaxID=289376 RepID=B5YH95_THEYD|nr:type III-A CRISPR-associated RAMP protein Csm4 [Thermodesulfovibrio yellowstonii]ACI21834.1 CRISPR-associated RAMP protein, Csm4 family [Thermodesulfovibrio yellowstonii DSM 11347]
MVIYSYKLHFKTPVHFGETGIYLENVEERFSSDSLFSALINTVSNYYGEKESEKWIDKFENNPPFLLSSLFIYNSDKYFLPKPLDDSFISREIRKKIGKELKKIRWLEAKDFLLWQKRQITKVEDIEKIKINSERYSDAFKREIRPRVTIDRITSQSSIYFCGSIKFQREAGLYGMVAFRDTDFIERFRIVMKLLGQTGIGGERTYGYGMFELKDFKPIDGVLKKLMESDTEGFTLLSLYTPSNTEIDDLVQKIVAYEIKIKKGWITSGRTALPLKRKSLGFIKEGSVFSKPLRGCLVDVTPENAPPDILKHKVYRYGYAFTVPLKE